MRLERKGYTGENGKSGRERLEQVKWTRLVEKRYTGENGKAGNGIVKKNVS